MKKILALGAALLTAGAMAVQAAPKIYIAFQWHMHQPIYTPGLNPMEVDATNEFSFNIVSTHTDRTGAYTSWPASAVKKLINAGLPGGAQVSFSGSLIENLNAIEAAGKGFKNWKSNWIDMISQKTDLGHQRLDMVGFGYYHPLMALIDPDDIERQIAKHKDIFAENFPGMPYSKGIFPPENAFEEHMIPPLVRQGLEWVFVDNAHFDRTCEGLPYEKNFSIVEPNLADVVNPNPNDWMKLTDMYAPGKISGGWGHRPHRIQYVDPADGKTYKMIAVPTSLLFGNEDGRGGFGALQYEKCLSQLEPYNTDEDHPILVVMHHDGDNHGGGSESYYGSNFQNFVNWLKANPDRFECTTIDDYLQRFPPAEDDVIHVEPGSWYGAGADPEFLKWNGDKGTYAGADEPYSPDHNSWGIITAASNVVRTATAIAPDDARVKEAWDYLMVGETSCYWYWDGTENWDSKTSVAANRVNELVGQLAKSGADKVGPSIYHPQREAYNPGMTEWGYVKDKDFTIWTYAYDVSGLKSVKLKYRLDKDGKNPMNSIQNETYAGGDEVGEWQEVEMTGKAIPSITNPQPAFKAMEYSADLKGLKNKLVDYYVEATDNAGNVSRSMILHVYVGKGTEANAEVSISPNGGKFDDTLDVTITPNSECVTAQYQIGDAAAVSITKSVVVTIGADMAIGDKVVISWRATDSEGDIFTGNAEFTKVDPADVSKGRNIYLDNSLANWTKPHIYFWDPTGNSGQTPMELVGDNIWHYTVPAELTGMLFSQGDWNSQTVDILDSDIIDGHIYRLSGSHKYSVTHEPYLTGIENAPAPSYYEVEVVNGKLTVNASSTSTITVTTLTGVSRTLAVLPGCNTYNELPAGFYIVDGKKFILR